MGALLIGWPLFLLLKIKGLTEPWQNLMLELVHGLNTKGCWIHFWYSKGFVENIKITNKIENYKYDWESMINMLCIAWVASRVQQWWFEIQDEPTSFSDLAEEDILFEVYCLQIDEILWNSLDFLGVGEGINLISKNNNFN